MIENFHAPTGVVILSWRLQSTDSRNFSNSHLHERTFHKYINTQKQSHMRPLTPFPPFLCLAFIFFPFLFIFHSSFISKQVFFFSFFQSTRTFFLLRSFFFLFFFWLSVRFRISAQCKNRVMAINIDPSRSSLLQLHTASCVYCTQTYCVFRRAWCTLHACSVCACVGRVEFVCAKGECPFVLFQTLD